MGKEGGSGSTKLGAVKLLINVDVGVDLFAILRPPCPPVGFGSSAAIRGINIVDHVATYHHGHDGHACSMRIHVHNELLYACIVVTEPREPRSRIYTFLFRHLGVNVTSPDPDLRHRLDGTLVNFGA